MQINCFPGSLFQLQCVKMALWDAFELEGLLGAVPGFIYEGYLKRSIDMRGSMLLPALGSPNVPPTHIPSSDLRMMGPLNPSL